MGIWERLNSYFDKLYGCYSWPIFFEGKYSLLPSYLPRCKSPSLEDILG
ncbi:MAG: hypothetical protein RIR11_2644 [Bacteroidota bacterium]|jgi:alpha-D-ribose 1-methylphosphonate 5-phosphate C-P lyase